MIINGLQKLTLLDFPGKTACTVFLAGCNMRCPFCHNSELLDMNTPAQMTDEDFFKFLQSRKGLLDGVAITGGEPTMRKDLPDFIKKIKDLGYSVKLDSNGTNPEMLEKLINDGLVDYIAMDIKNSPEKYGQTAGLEKIDLAKINRSISLLIQSNIEYEFRTTVVDQLHDEDSFKAIGPMIKGAKRYFLQAFTDRDTVVFSGFSAPTKEKMQKYAQIASEYVKKVEIRGI